MLLLRLLLLVALAAALPIDKRADVTMTTTQNVGWAQIFGLTTSTTPLTTAVAPTTTALAVAATTTAVATPVATTAAAATTTSSGGFWKLLLSYFDGDSSSGTTTTAAAAATTTAAAAAATTATTTSSSSGSWLSNLLGSLFGSSSSSTASTTAAASSAATVVASYATASLAASDTSTAESPGFTGLVTVVGAGSGSSGVAATGTAQVASSTNVAAVAKYAEMGAGITYSPYTKDGLCKTASEVAADIEMLSAFSLIRLYAVDCSGIENVVAAMLSLQKLYLGIWDITAVSTDLPNMKTQVLTGLRGWAAVHTVAIGNEVVNSGRGTAAQVAAAVDEARTWFELNASAYTGYIVTVDTLLATLADPLLMCDISDYLAVNCHPYFSGVEALTSGTWLKEQVALLKLACGSSKSILITESGWPTYGDTVGSAVPLVANQLLLIKSLGTVMGDLVIMFTTYNDYWKDPGLYNVEQHWGIYGDPDY